MTKVEVAEQFMVELRELLAKYEAVITADDHWMGYSECGQDIRMSVDFKDWEMPCINLNSFVDPTSRYDVEEG